MDDEKSFVVTSTLNVNTDDQKNVNVSKIHDNTIE